jgi:predicted dehydrogenase/threonine dehydrogenase-like Zn-dependent dehydrogenase
MKQLLQDVRDGRSWVTDVPAPSAAPGRVLVQTAASLVSAGTERMVIDFARKNLLQKARARPDLARQVVRKVQQQGVLSAIEAAKGRLDWPLGLGYSAAGRVIAVGSGVDRFKIGDRVACAGAGHACHAEVISIPVNLAVHVPEDVSWEAAAFTTVGAVAVQGLRLGVPQLGEFVAVIGLGLLGQITVQLARAAGCAVVGMDPQPSRAELAVASGAHDVATSRETFTRLCERRAAGRGVDLVLITADTKSDDPLALAGDIARDRGVVVAVGAVGTHVPRKPFYEKELDFRISRSYGPGRYDPSYEERGEDYPYGYVRWTENRNMEAFVRLMAERQVDVQPLITHRFSIERAAEAYALIAGEVREPYLGVVLTYPLVAPPASRRVNLKSAVAAASDEFAPMAPVRVGVVGPGKFARAVLLPVLKRTPGVELVGVSAASGLTARSTADRFAAGYCTTDTGELLDDETVNTIVIATRHHLHARQTIDALTRGKHVFVEKPPCLSRQELADIVAAQVTAGRLLMVGFNRRFAPMAVRVKQFFADTKEPLILQYRVNAGFVPQTDWTQDRREGGGRLIGEVPHFIDLAMWLAGDTPISVSANALPNAGRYSDDNFALTITFANGSVAQILYSANGSPALPKERLEIHGGSRSAVLNDFRRLELFDRTRSVARSWFRQDKGHQAEWTAFAGAIQNGGPAPISMAEIVAVMETVFCAQDSMQSGSVVQVLPTVPSPLLA